MRLVLLAVGRLKAGPERELAQRYADRTQALSRSVGLSGFASREVDEGRGRTAAERMREESRALQSEFVPAAYIIALDERGEPISSQAFAAEIATARDAGRPAVTLVIGGADGLDPAIRSTAQRVIGFGAATFPHQLVRILAAEQCYRALTILAGHPYHRA